MSADKLTVKQRRFIEAYTGNATEAAILAGYRKQSARAIGAENLTKPNIIAAIQAREQNRLAKSVLTREERLIWWSDMMMDKGQKTADRLRASELLARAEGDFLDRVEHTGPGGAPVELRTVIEFVKSGG